MNEKIREKWSSDLEEKLGQIFRLICTFFIVNPPRGGNVTKGELLEPLIKDKTDKKNHSEKPWLSYILKCPLAELC